METVAVSLLGVISGMILLPLYVGLWWWAQEFIIRRRLGYELKRDEANETFKHLHLSKRF